MTATDYDVSIVGYGPVGAFAALLLASRGLRVSIHERSREALALPRAVGLDGESVRSFQAIGLSDQIVALLQPPREGEELWFTDSKRQKLFGLEVPAAEGHQGWRDLAFFDQPELEARLREFVAARDEIDVFLGEEAVAISQTDEAVRLELRSVENDATRHVRAAYLIGCDGASSFVRRHLGIEWTSLGYDQDWLVIDIATQATAELPIHTMQVCDPERLTTYVCVKDPFRRWEFQLVEGETREEMVRPERIRALLDSWLPADQYELRRAVVYQFHAATAERWREGRVLLAGDAAHQTPPFLGQGLNAGFRDAFNLGWKIPLVLSGDCGEGLLDSYFDERDAHARDLVDWAVGIGKLMETLAAREAGRPDPYPEASQNDGYGQGRTAPPLRSGALMTAQRELGFAVGEHFRQPHVRRLPAEGRSSKRLDELLGRDFALVGRTRNDLALGADAERIASQLGIARLALDEIEIARGELDRSFESSPALLVRPDRHIFGVADDHTSIDDVVRALAEKICLVEA